jgi:hypothetical protein
MSGRTQKLSNKFGQVTRDYGGQALITMLPSFKRTRFLHTLPMFFKVWLVDLMPIRFGTLSRDSQPQDQLKDDADNYCRKDGENQSIRFGQLLPSGMR